MLAASACAATLIYLRHPTDPHDEGLLVGTAAFLWPFIILPLAWAGCIVLTILDCRRGIVRRGLLGLLLATAAWPLVFSGYLLNQKPWLSPAQKLQDAWPDVRAHGAWILGERVAPEGIPLLISALKDPDSRVRSTAATGLGRYGSRAESAIPALVAALDDEDWFVGCQAGKALGSMLGLQKKVLPPLLAHFADSRAHQSWCAVTAIQGLGSEGAQSIPALIRELSVEDANVRSAACETLGGIGPAATVAVPELTAALEDKNHWVRKAARDALSKIQGNR
jgi:HEAT repeat protein